MTAHREPAHSPVQSCRPHGGPGNVDRLHPGGAESGRYHGEIPRPGTQVENVRSNRNGRLPKRGRYQLRVRLGTVHARQAKHPVRHGIGRSRRHDVSRQSVPGGIPARCSTKLARLTHGRHFGVSVNLWRRLPTPELPKHDQPSAGFIRHLSGYADTARRSDVARASRRGPYSSIRPTARDLVACLPSHTECLRRPE